ncbi:MAG: DNA-3-methyladenine glycosylase I [Candidatus Dormibacteria bacterium]
MTDRLQTPAVREPPIRCPWAIGPWLTPYHDSEWGVPVHDDRRHFELLILEGAQAGLSWLTVLKRREGYRRAFADFDPVEVATFGQAHVQSLLTDPGIIRHREKVESVVGNALALLRIQNELDSFDAFIWGFVAGLPVVNRWSTQQKVPATSPLAVAVSAALRGRGFRFVGPTSCYAYLQSAGLVMDHLVDCFRFEQLVGGKT